LGWARAQSSGPDEEGVDVIVLLIDVLGADDLGCYGYERPTSPHIDAFASDSVVFENAIASSTYTKTSVASLFSGRFPHNHGVYDGHFPEIDARVTADLLEEEIPTMAESFSEHGWTCAGWTANGQILSYMGFAQGFDLYDDRAGKLPVMARKFRRWSGRWLGRKRSFCYLHVIDLHAPYNPGPGYRGRFGHTEAGLPEIEEQDWHATRNAINQKKRPFGPEDLEAYHARHDEVLVFVDEWVGRMLDELKAEGRYDESLIVLLGDHGDAFWEHGFIEHSHMPYDELVNVPLIIKLPGSAQAGRRVDAMVGLVDVAPTLLEVVGAAAPEGMDGKSFRDLLLNPEAPSPRRTIFSEYKTIISVRTDDWKYISRPGHPQELYDLNADPGERINVFEGTPDVAARMSLAAEAAAAKRDAREGNVRVELDRETIQALRELGYL
jgi:arylsulfatase A-like enzyme